MALTLAQAEKALLDLTGDQVDAIVNPEGKAYLLRPAQEQLIEKERWLDAVIESSADVITVVNRQGAIISQSRPVNRVLGYEQEELVGTSLFRLIRDEDLATVHSAFFNVIEGIQEHATAQFSHRTRDGSYRMVEATMGKLRTEESASVVLSLRPLAHPTRESIELEKREADAAKSGPAKDRFLAMLAHELRTPLMPVLLGISEMQEDERFADARTTLEMMRRNIEMQSRLLEELTDFTTVGQHQVRLRPERVDVHDALSFTLEICKTEITAARIAIDLNLRALETEVVADSVRLQQVMWNLIRNAVKFSPSGGSISITSANENNGAITISVIDRGIGIAQEFLPKVFDPFQQGDEMIQKRFGGLGLGMFIAKGLAEAQGGALTVSSAGLGHGTTFRLTLSLAPRVEIAPVIVLIGGVGASGNPARIPLDP
jgi:PAS domain S-box-containing protein